MTLSADYLVAGSDTRDQIDWTPDWTRRARGFAVYAALRELGRDGVADLVERSCDHASALAHGIAALHGAELVAAPTLNQALVRFRSPAPEATEADHDARTLAVIAAINAEGTAFFSGTVWQGRREHTSELQSLMPISYAVFCLKKKNINTIPKSHP